MDRKDNQLLKEEQLELQKVQTDSLHNGNSLIKEELHDETDDLGSLLHSSIEIKDELLQSIKTEGGSEEADNAQLFFSGEGNKSNYTTPSLVNSIGVVSEGMNDTSSGKHGTNIVACDGGMSKAFNPYVRLVDLFPTHIQRTRNVHTNHATCLCIYCNKNRFAGRTSKKIATNFNNRELLRCNLCSVSFATIITLQNHILETHTGEKPFICHLCSARFPFKSNLNVHIRTHTGERPFSCSNCSASFAQKGGLKIHIRKHTGEKPFSCTHCSASFAQNITLKNHMRTHTGEKSFICPHCSAPFALKSSLNVHIRTHTGERRFSCSNCSASFAQKEGLKVHIRTHTGEKPFSCSHCSASFARKDHCKRHMITHRLDTGLHS